MSARAIRPWNPSKHKKQKHEDAIAEITARIKSMLSGWQLCLVASGVDRMILLSQLSHLPLPGLAT
jgi:hypothetical protein